jgi:hypothetical protein
VATPAKVTTITTLWVVPARTTAANYDTVDNHRTDDDGVDSVTWMTDDAMWNMVVQVMAARTMDACIVLCHKYFFQLNTKLYLFNTLQIHAYLPNIL